MGWAREWLLLRFEGAGWDGDLPPPTLTHSAAGWAWGSGSDPVQKLTVHSPQGEDGSGKEGGGGGSSSETAPGWSLRLACSEGWVGWGGPGLGPGALVLQVMSEAWADHLEELEQCRRHFLSQ